MLAGTAGTSNGNGMDTIEFTRMNPLLNVWEVRLNGDGEEFDAICIVKAEADDTAYISGLMSRVPRGWHRIAKLGKPKLYEMGFRRMRYRRNSVDYTVELTPGDPK